MDTSVASGMTLAERLAALTRRGLDLSAVFTTVTTHAAVDGTKAVAHCHHVALDGSSLPRLSDFTDEVANWLLDYVTPRRLLMAASSSTDLEARLKNERLRRRAIDTFKKHGMSGEQGEMLLFVLAESFLKLPQLLCKMDLKTDGEMHFHGLDGVHCGPGDGPDELAIYWCESKVHKDLDGALSEAFDGLKPFLLGPGTGGSDKRRELALLDHYMDLADAELQKQILDSINPHSVAFNKVSWRGICLVGFDYDYPQKPNQIKHAEFTAKVKAAFPDWCKMAKSRAVNRGVESFEIHIFYVPFGFCDDFRNAMKTSLGLTS
ncbi:hypothetical protein J2R76_004012 [Bradyrhizobium sp. USDA 4532]|uniref:HamA C-terminal domain-containing protein n=1 Tax=unclassified Bradyrhizobium TaxID=2631580 RepID=UPI0020A18985|nr:MULTISPECIES: DUF1837 domain-containing protein [unclassified Bradyrhizobium]MCP1835672.1 hypothetical protein [Bradyrhizobium sp. USDA 4545]MCP1920421.1 hypothetical protein [Bradyrhizobium sp. USDA 4532]